MTRNPAQFVFQLSKTKVQKSEVERLWLLLEPARTSTRTQRYQVLTAVTYESVYTRYYLLPSRTTAVTYPRAASAVVRVCSSPSEKQKYEKNYLVDRDLNRPKTTFKKEFKNKITSECLFFFHHFPEVHSF